MDFVHQILSLTRLPFPPSSHGCGKRGTPPRPAPQDSAGRTRNDQRLKNQISHPSYSNVTPWRGGRDEGGLFLSRSRSFCRGSAGCSRCRRRLRRWNLSRRARCCLRREILGRRCSSRSHGVFLLHRRGHMAMPLDVARAPAQAQAQEHENCAKPHGDFDQEGLSSARSTEHGLGGASKGRSHVRSFALLDQDHNDKKRRHNNVQYV